MQVAVRVILVSHWDECVADVYTTAAAPASEVEAIVQSPTNMAATKIAAVDFIDLY